MKDSPLLLQQIDALQLSIKHLKNENNRLKVRCRDVPRPVARPRAPAALSGSWCAGPPGLGRAVCREVEQGKREGKAWGGWGERGATVQGTAIALGPGRAARGFGCCQCCRR